jgi:predicted DNA-binding transcriptional regulator YafY
MEELNRFDRIVAMLIHLQSGRVVKAQELADRFQVSLRTVYRDVKSLEVLGVPVIGEAGVGYSLMEGYRLPPVMFTREEAGSFVAAEKLMQKFSDKTLANAYESAMFKIKSVLRNSAKGHIAALETRISIEPTQELFNEHTPDALGIIMESLAEKRQLSILYQSFHGDETTERLIEPVGLFNENNFWYVMAYCHLRKDYRQFRTDRIFQIGKTQLPFTGEHGQVDEYRKKQAPVEKTKVILRVHKTIVKYLRSGRKYYGFVSEKEVGDRVEMTFFTNSPEEGLARWYLMFGDMAEIVSPESFRSRVNELLEKTRANLGLQAG